MNSSDDQLIPTQPPGGSRRLLYNLERKKIMFNTTTRGRLQAAGALMISIMLIWAVALFGGTSASAQSQPVPSSTQVTITKLSQPGTLGSAATGEPISVEPADGIGGVIFEYYKVENTGEGETADIGTNAGQQAAEKITPDTEKISDTPTGVFIATSTTGETTKNLPRGLYVVKENLASVPAGVTASAPFMLTVPMTDPTNLNDWLDHIYVYPKNSRISAEKKVENAEDLIVGNTVTWTINADIPRVENPASTGADDQFLAPDYFRIDDTLQDGQLVLNPVYKETGNNTGIRVTAGGTSLTEGTDYGITKDVLSTPGSSTYQILFTESGRGALATAINADADAVVTVEIDTTVVSSQVIENTASIYPNQNALTQNRPLNTPAADVRYGSYNFQKGSSDQSLTDLSGAQFRVYADKTAAETGSDEFLQPANGGHTNGIWTTDPDGKINISGLRYSGFANGVSVAPGAEGYVTYYLVEIKALDGHQLLAAPVEFTVDGETGKSNEGWVADQTIINQANTGAFVLPLTGGSGTAMLTIAGIAILAMVLFLARRRSAAEA